MNHLKAHINTLARTCHYDSAHAGWWEEAVVGQVSFQPGKLFAEKIALIHSELSEALEGNRKGLMDDHLPSRSMQEVELADAVIRIMDLAGAMKMDIGGAIAEKLEYNREREDHKRENRAKEGGKKY